MIERTEKGLIQPIIPRGLLHEKIIVTHSSYTDVSEQISIILKVLPKFRNNPGISTKSKKNVILFSHVSGIQIIVQKLKKVIIKILMYPINIVLSILEGKYKVCCYCFIGKYIAYSMELCIKIERQFCQIQGNRTS